MGTARWRESATTFTPPTTPVTPCIWPTSRTYRCSWARWSFPTGTCSTHSVTPGRCTRRPGRSAGARCTSATPPVSTTSTCCVSWCFPAGRFYAPSSLEGRRATAFTRTRAATACRRSRCGTSTRLAGWWDVSTSKARRGRGRREYSSFNTTRRPRTSRASSRVSARRTWRGWCDGTVPTRNS